MHCAGIIPVPFSYTIWLHLVMKCLIIFRAEKNMNCIRMKFQIYNTQSSSQENSIICLGLWELNVYHGEKTHVDNCITGFIRRDLKAHNRPRKSPSVTHIETGGVDLPYCLCIV